MHKKQKERQSKVKFIDEGQCYIVQQIVNRHIFDGQVKYEVKWKGYPSSQNTFQPIQNLSHVLDMVQAFQELELEQNAIIKMAEYNQQKKHRRSQLGHIVSLQQKIIKNQNNKIKLTSKMHQKSKYQKKTKIIQKKSLQKTKQKQFKRKQKKKSRFEDEKRNKKGQNNRKNKPKIDKLQQRTKYNQKINDNNKNQSQQIKDQVIEWLKQFQQQQSYNLFQTIKACQLELRLQKTEQEQEQQSFDEQNINNGGLRESFYWGEQSNSQKFQPFDSSQKQEDDDDEEFSNNQANYVSPANNPNSRLQVQSLLSQICKNDQQASNQLLKYQKKLNNQQQIYCQDTPIASQFLTELQKQNIMVQTRQCLKQSQMDRILSDKFLQLKQFLDQKPILKQIKQPFKISSQLLFEVQLEQYIKETKFICYMTLLKYYRREFDQFVIRIITNK